MPSVRTTVVMRWKGFFEVVLALLLCSWARVLANSKGYWAVGQVLYRAIVSGMMYC